QKPHAQDEQFVRVLLDHMIPEEDPWVVRSAITALIHVYPKLSPLFRDELVQRCTELLRTSTHEVTCSAASWGVRQAGAAQSIRDLWDILKDDRHAPWVQAYHVGALASLLVQHRVNRQRF